MKKIYTLFILSFCIIIFQSGVKSLNFSGTPPIDRTGATGIYCTACHSGTLNGGGGNVTLTGLPVGGYTLSQQYNLSLNISHPTPNRSIWGFSIKAVKSGGSSIGTFSTTNSNAALNFTELSHNGAASTSPSSSFTYDNLKWTAPSSGTDGVTFYFVANAANGDGGTSGDFIYASTSIVALPIELNNFSASNDNNNIILKWQTSVEINSNYFDVERSDDGQFFFSIGKVDAVGNSTKPQSYSFVDSKLSYNNGSQIFYRLKLVDKDGSSKYSNHISIKPVFNGITIKNIYPTIIRQNENINVEIASDKSRAMNIIVLDEMGRTLQLIKANLNVGSNRVNFIPNTSNKKGMIFVKFVSDNFQQTKSLIQQ